jgi:hypothetical protein
MVDPGLDDALIEELLDEALDGYDGIVAPEIMAAIRAQLGDTLAATESGRRLLRQVRPDPVVSRSADLELPAAGESAQARQAARGAKKGGRR